MKMPNLRNTAIGLGAAAMAGGALYKPETPENGPWERRDAAAEELRDSGITEEQRRAYALGISEALRRGINPSGNQEHLLSILEGIPHNLLFTKSFPQKKPGYKVYNENLYPIREDGFRLYLGMPQQHGSFEISRYRPAKAEKDMYYYAVKDWFKNFCIYWAQEEGELHFDPEKKLEKVSILQQMVEACESAKKNKDIIKGLFKEQWDILAHDEPLSREDSDKLSAINDTLMALHVPPFPITNIAENGIIVIDHLQLGDVKVSLGHDDQGEYLSYYDCWDFGQPGQGIEGIMDASTHVVGKPFEVYDRVYFDRKTWSVVAPVSQ